MEKKNIAEVEKGGGSGTAAQSGRDALLYIAVCIIGLPVEVQLKDGSLYHGVFHTASFQHGIVLKKATKVGNGKCQTNLAIGNFVDTLVILACDLVQVIVKDLTLPGEEVSCDFDGNDIEAANACSEKSEMDLHVSTKVYLGPNWEKTCSDANNMDCSTTIEKAGEQPLVSVSLQERQIMEHTAAGQKHGNNFEKMVHEDECLGSRSTSANEVRCRVPAPVTSQLVDRENKNSDSANLTSSVVKVPQLSTSTVYVSEPGVSPCHCQSSSPDIQVPNKNTVNNISTKASKLSPSAKAFTPSVASFQPLFSAVPTISTPAYMSNGVQIMPISNQQLGTDFNSFGNHTSMPSKLVAYNNSDARHSVLGAPYVRPVLCHGNIIQDPVRFDGQYHTVQGASHFVNPPSQTVMVGRLGQLVYANPIPQDTIHVPSVISQGLPNPQLSPYPANVEKIQGSAASTVQLAMTPTIMAGGNQTVLMPNYVPFPQPFLLIRPVMASGGTGFFSSKYE